MITIIRTVRMSDTKPAGEIFTFNKGNAVDIQEASNFMWGKDINNYLVFKDGFALEPESDLAKLEERLWDI